MTPEADLWPAHEQEHGSIPPTPAPYNNGGFILRDGESSASMGLIENDNDTIVLFLGEYQDI